MIEYRTEGSMIYLFGSGSEKTQEPGLPAHLENRKGSEVIDSLCGKESAVKKIRRPYVVDGQQIWITGTNEQEIAENYAEAFLSAKGFSPTQVTMRHNLCELIDKWFEYKKDKKEITLRTAKNYDTHVRSIKNHFVGKSVEDVRWTDIQTSTSKTSQPIHSGIPLHPSMPPAVR